MFRAYKYSSSGETIKADVDNPDKSGKRIVKVIHWWSLYKKQYKMVKVQPAYGIYFYFFLYVVSAIFSIAVNKKDEPRAQSQRQRPISFKTKYS